MLNPAEIYEDVELEYYEGLEEDLEDAPILQEIREDYTTSKAAILIADHTVIDENNEEILIHQGRIREAEHECRDILETEPGEDPIPEKSVPDSWDKEISIEGPKDTVTAALEWYRTRYSVYKDFKVKTISEDEYISKIMETDSENNSIEIRDSLLTKPSKFMIDNKE